MCPIRKRTDIIIRILVRLIWVLNFDSKENDGKRSFSCESKASISCILIRMYFYSPITKRIEIVARILTYLILGMNFDPRIIMERNFFLWNKSINIKHPNKVNVFLKLNHKKNGVCYKNPCLSHLWDELWS